MKNLKRVLSAALCLLMLLSVLPGTAFAAQDGDTIKKEIAISYTNSSGVHEIWMHYDEQTREALYCINQLAQSSNSYDTEPGNITAAATDYWNYLPYEVKVGVAHVLLFAPKYYTWSTKQLCAGAQILVWEYVHGNRTWGDFDTYPHSYNGILGSSANAEALKAYQDILKKMETYHKIPSFDMNTVNVPNTGEPNAVHTLYDNSVLSGSNSVFSNLWEIESISDSRVHASITSGDNRVKVWIDADEDINATIKLRHKPVTDLEDNVVDQYTYSAQWVANYTYNGSPGQEMMRGVCSPLLTDPYDATIYVKHTKSFEGATIVKTIPGVDKPDDQYKNWTFTVKDNVTGETKSYTTADGYGTISVPDLVIGRSYTITETPKPNYLADEASKTITIQNGENTVEFINRPLETATIVKTIPGVDKPNDRYKGWTFTVKDNVTGETKSYTTEDGNGTIDVPNLIVGRSYTITETKKPNYIPDKESITVTIVKGENTVEFINNLLEKATIVKTIPGVAKPNDRYKGWTFTVKDSVTGETKDYTTTDGSGTIDVPDLIVGRSYTITENLRPNYIPDSSSISVTIKPGENKVEFINRPLGEMTMIKAISSADGTKDGYCFQIENTTSGKKWYGISTEDGSIYSTDASFTEVAEGSRVFKFEGLTDGDYNITELLSRHGAEEHIITTSVEVSVTDSDGNVTTKTYSGLDLKTNSDGDCTVSNVHLEGLIGGQLTITFVNAKDTRPVTVKKTMPGVAAPDARLAGWKIIVTDKDGNKVAEGTTDENGIFVTQKFKIGTVLTFSEVQQEPYVADAESKTITVSGKESENVVSFLNTKRADMEIVKVSADGGPVDGFCFKLENTSDGKVFYGISDGEGKVYIADESFAEDAEAERKYLYEGVTDGTYVLTELLSKRGADEYIILTSVKVTVVDKDGNETVTVYDGNKVSQAENGDCTVNGVDLANTLGGQVKVEFTNKYEMRKATIIKTIQGVTAPSDLLKDWEFTVIDKATGEQVFKGKTNNKGELATPELYVGHTYTVIETPRDGYVADKDRQDITIKKTGKNEVTFLNRPEGTMTIFKDSVEGTKAGFRFIVENTTTGEKWYGISTEDGSVYRTDETFAEVAEADRGFEFAGLLNGSYTLTEVFDFEGAPDNYATKSVLLTITDYNGEEHVIYKDGESIVQLENGNFEIKDIEITNIVGGSMKIEFLNKNLYGALKVIKVFKDIVMKIPGVTFGIFDVEGNLVAEGTTDENGEVFFDNLPFGEYIYRELKVPEYCKLDETEYPFTIKSIEPLEVNVEDDMLTVDIEINKKDTDNKPLGNAEFTLEYSLDNGATWRPVASRAGDAAPSVGTTSTQGVAEGRINTGADGKAVYAGLLIADPETREFIKYRLRETKAPTGYVLNEAVVYEGFFNRENGLAIDENGKPTGEFKFTYDVVNKPEPHIPQTGDNATNLPFYLAGTAALALAGLCVVSLRKRKLGEI